ncbi:MAG TPA: type II toxin-antitoxin system VapC family toxin [Actinomycetales bacterium]|nr:type II toxin-antitoxin system VapC family toxin [Actinomycetales bacterium]
MIVVDTAAVIDALRVTADSDRLRDRLSAEELHAPNLLDYEVMSAVRGLVLGGHLSAPGADDVLTDFDDLEIRRWPSTDGLRRRSLQLRDNVSAYDAAYVALAEALACPLVTRDRRLARTTGHDARVEVL